MSNTVMDPLEVSELFVEFLCNKVLKLAKELPEVLRSPKANNNPIIYTHEELKLELTNKKSKHCFGFNGIPLRIAKDFCKQLPCVAIRYFNRLSSKDITDNQRVARIIPLHKKGTKTDIANYQLIATLCSVSKIYEKLLY
jgi:hypothetical protein